MAAIILSIFYLFPWFTLTGADQHIQPGGKYIQSFYRESEENARLCYQKIFDYVAEHSLALSGFSYEVIINENVIDRMEDALVQIEVPIHE